MYLAQRSWTRSSFGFRLLPSMFFGPGGTPLPGVNTPLPHSAPNAATSPFYKTYSALCRRLIPMRIQARPVSSARMQSNSVHSSALIIRAAAITSSITLRLLRQRFLRLIAKPSMAHSRAICVTNT